MRIVVTGAAGDVGHRLCHALSAAGHDVLGIDLNEVAADTWRFEQADLDDLDAVTGLFGDHRAEGVVHLAGNPVESSLPDALHSHVLLTQTVLRAMTATGARRLVYASSGHAVGFATAATTTDGVLPADTRARPDTYYGVGKAAAEALISLWVDRYGIEAVCVRIGAVQERPWNRHLMAIWLSHADAARLVDAALTAPDVRYEVVFGVSANTRGWWDLGPALALGYRPQDDSEQFAAEVATGEENEASRHERRFAGGSFIEPSVFWENRSKEERS